MPRKNPLSPTSSYNTSSQSPLDRARDAIAKFLPLVSTMSFDLGMASAIACAIGAIAAPTGGLDEEALLTLMSRLGVNWLASAVQRWRDQVNDLQASHQPAFTIHDLARTLLPQMTDQRLPEVIKQLNLVQATLTGLKGNQTALDAIARDALARGYIKSDELQRIGQSIQVSFAGDVIGSMINIAGGDITLSHVTINYHGRTAREDLAEEIAEYKTALAKTLSRMDLIGFEIDPAKKRSLHLESMYTPLRANAIQIVTNETNHSLFDMTKRDGTSRIVTISRGGAREKNAENENANEPTSILIQLNDMPRTVILGGPGSGKSTVLNYLGLLLCGRATEYQAEWQHGMLLPLHVTLRWFARYVRTKLADIDPTDPERVVKQANREAFRHLLKGEPEKVLLEYVKANLKNRSEQPLPKLMAHLETYLEQNGGVWLLDGLDEVPALQREDIRRAIENLVQDFPRCRFIVACRPYSYRHTQPEIARSLKISPSGIPFTELDVLPLRPPEIGIFADKWYRLLTSGGVLPHEHQPRARELFDRIVENPRLLQLASQPLLLRMMANLHSSGRPLPEDRWELLKRVIELLLLTWQERLKDDLDSEREQRVHDLLSSKRDEAMSKLRQLAYDIHRDTDTQLDAEQATDIPPARLTKMLSELITPECGVNTEDIVTYLRDRSGIILHEGTPDGNDHRYRFPHRMFQEYLTAENLQGKYDEDEVGFVSLLDGDADRWREVYALIALMNDVRRTADCALFICPKGTLPGSNKDWARVFLAIEIWADKHPTLDDLRSNRPRESVRSLHDQLLHAFTAPSSGPGAITPELRAEVGRKLVLLPNSDPVRFTCADHRHAACANLRTPEGLAAYAQQGFVFIAAKDKTFTMQAGAKNPGPVTLVHDYLIGKTPVTYAQFEAFVEDADGYRNDAHWTQSGLDWRGDRTHPNDWQDSKWHIPNHPIVKVTWYEANAFCCWLTQKLQDVSPKGEARLFTELGSDFEIGLPSELEWEYAARRDTGRHYPWKKEMNDAWVQGDEVRCNVRETGLERTSAVGIFTDGATPDGLYDLTGNVWEWIGTIWDEDWREGKYMLDGDTRRGVRGGPWYNTHEEVLSIRYGAPSNYSQNDYGFRVVVRTYLSIAKP